jgi:adenosine deaminase
MFHTSLSREYQIAQKHFGFTDEHLRELARNSFEASFLDAERKIEFLNLFDAPRFEVSKFRTIESAKPRVAANER